MATGSPVTGETFQVGLCSGRAGTPFLVGTSTWAFMGWQLLGSFPSARQLSSSCELCWLLEQTARGALPDGFGETNLVCSGQSAQLLLSCYLVITRSRTSTWEVGLWAWSSSSWASAFRKGWVRFQWDALLSPVSPAAKQNQPGHHNGECPDMWTGGQGRIELRLSVAAWAGSGCWTAA